MRRAVASIALSAILTATWLHAFVQVQIFGEIHPRQGQPLELVLFHTIYSPCFCGAERDVKKRIEDALNGRRPPLKTKMRMAHIIMHLFFVSLHLLHLILQSSQSVF